MTSPRVAPGLLSRAAWTALAAADSVRARSLEDPLAAAVDASGLTVTPAEEGMPPARLARELVAAAEQLDVIWLGGPEGDHDLTDALGAELTRRESPPEVEVLVGSWDVPGGRLLDAVAVMDRLRSEGGCPWDAEQTHITLAPYLLEEAHEVVEAIAGATPEDPSPLALADELGDVLLQVLFHARVAEDAEQGFDIDTVAGLLVAKLIRRHPHVFAGDDADTPEQVEANWEQIKADERRASGQATDEDDLLHGIPASLPALQTAQKVITRLDRRQLAPGAVTPGIGADLLALVRRARAEGLDAESALRATIREVAARA